MVADIQSSNSNKGGVFPAMFVVRPVRVLTRPLMGISVVLFNNLMLCPLWKINRRKIYFVLPRI